MKRNVDVVKRAGARSSKGSEAVRVLSRASEASTSVAATTKYKIYRYHFRSRYINIVTLHFDDWRNASEMILYTCF